MAGSTGYSSIVTNGLVFAYDVADTRNSYLGRPTSNILANAGMSIYNNVPGSVSATLTATSETYRGATVYRQDLTALDASGASWLSGCNNPGIGVVTGGGGGNANQYSGHSIYFKTTVPMCSTPIYLHYSNIGGWQSCCTPPEDMGDGWFRAYVLWYNTVTQSDGKYWAINPASTPVNQTITIYWAGPFREDLNSTTISQFINGSRSSSQSVLDLSGTKSTVTVNNNPFTTPAINPQLNFDGTDDYVSSDRNIVHGTSEFSYFALVRLQGKPSLGTIFENGSWTSCLLIRYETNGITIYSMGSYWGKFSFDPPLNTWYYLGFVRRGNTLFFYVNGILTDSMSFSANISPSSNLFVGTSQHAPSQCFNGSINVASVYTRALSDTEISQNYNRYRSKYSLPGIVYSHNEWNRADLYTGYWNNSTTFNMTDFGGLGNVTAHGFTSGPVTYTLTLPGLPTHTKVRYKVYWHLVDSLDNETNQLFIMNSSGGETEILRFTKQYNLSPSISIAASPGTYTWSGPKTYSYRPWANGAYNADGYIIVDSGWVDHTASSFTARHVMGADQAQADEAEYLSHVEVQLFG